MLALVIVGFYAVFALIGLLNLALMRRPGRAEMGEKIVVLIPARDEAANLKRLLPELLGPNPGLAVIVFDDESADHTAQIAGRLGARVISATEALPEGWTGKNRACYELARAAQETDAAWWLFLDADVQPGPDFLPAVRWLCLNVGEDVGLITGFPHVLPGKGIEPMFLAWVGWILLTTNPYGLVNRTGIGHSRFKNGQVHCWRSEVYQRLQPNLKVRSRIMEDVMIGRMLAREGVPVEVANLSQVLKVRMYERWREAFDGMSKNSFEITGNVLGSLGIAAFFLFAGWGWLLAGKLILPAYGLFLLSGVAVCLIARTVWWPLIFAPLIPTVGAITVLRSTLWHKRGRVAWKGRIYPHTKNEGRSKSDPLG